MATKVDPNEPVTRGVLDDAVGTLLKGMDNIAKDIGQEMKAGFNEAKAERGQIRNELKAEISYVKGEVRGLKADLSYVPSRMHFEELKKKVERYHPTS